MIDYGCDNTGRAVPVADRETAKGLIQDIDTGLEKLYDLLNTIDITINGNNPKNEGENMPREDSMIGDLIRQRWLVMHLAEIALHIREGIG